MDCARSLVAVVSVFQKIHDENNLNLIKSDKMLLCLDGWMDGWMDKRAGGWMDRWMDGRAGWWAGKWMDEWMDVTP